VDGAGVRAIDPEGLEEIAQAELEPDHDREDPYSPLALDHDDLRERDRAVFAWARAEGLPLAWVLAGGYTKDLSRVVAVHVGTFDAALEVYGDA
jgi:acetoin utilization deacetylase AcuC-like enzyme